MNKPGKKISILIFNSNSTEVERICETLSDSDLPLAINIASKQIEFVKKLIRLEPDVIIARPVNEKYKASEIYNDVRKALPFAYFMLLYAGLSEDEKSGFMLSGIDYFLPEDYTDILNFLVVQGFNKKHLEKTNHESKRILIENNHRLRAIFNNNQNAVFIVDFRNEILDFNPAALKEINAKSADSLAGTDVTKFIDKSQLKKFKNAHAAAFRGKKSTDEFTLSISRIIKKQVSINFVPILNEEGFPGAVILICKDVTEAYLFQQQFRLSEDRFMALANNAPVGVYFSNPDGRCVFVNKKWTEYTGQSFRESLGRGWMRCVHPDDMEYVTSIASDSRIKGKEFVVDFRILHSKEGVKWLRGKTSPFSDKNGKLQGFIGTVTDITQDKMQALEIAGAQKRQETIMHLADIAVWEVDLSNEAQPVKWSKYLFQLLERDPSSGSPTSREFLYTYVHPGDRDFVRSLIRNYIPGTTTDDFYYRAITTSGKLKYLRAMVTSENNLEGKPVRVLGFIQDITSLRQREEELKSSDEKFRYLFNHSPDAIYIEDLDGNILEVNEQACKIQEMGKDELIGKNISDLAPASISGEIKKKFKAMAQGDISLLHSFSWNKKGRRIPVQIKQNHILYNAKPALLLHVRKLES